MSKYLDSLAKFDAYDKKQSQDEKEKINALPPSGLNEGQAAAYKAMIEFVQQGEGNMLLLKGYAGTGKTYTITKFLEYYTSTRKHNQIAMTAPTNKAVKILRRSATIQNEAIHYATIHSLLGLREHITENGDQIFVSSYTDSPNIVNFHLLIIDEVSMLSDDLFLKIEPYKNRIKIIFTGDSAQIPPVFKTECIPFDCPEQYNITTICLDEIMRQKKGNSIIETSFIVRENLQSINLPMERVTSLNGDDKGTIHIKSSDEVQRENLITMIDKYFNNDLFKANSDHAKVISWTNKSVNQMNSMIRKMIFGEQLKKIMVGEKLIANSPIIKTDKLGKQILFSTNDEFEVISYEILTDKRFFFYYKTIVEEVLINGSKARKEINILHEESQSEFEKQLNKIKRDAIRETDPVRKKSEWRYYYDFISEYADVGYNYAITAHKAQGSTYENVFVLEDDIDQNKKVVERNRIKYTAFTRPTNKLFIVKR